MNSYESEDEKIKKDGITVKTGLRRPLIDQRVNGNPVCSGHR